MKNLKKVTAGFLSLSLLTCVGATQAFADAGSKTITTTDSTEISKATVGTVTNAEDSYNVEIAWGDLQYDCVEKWDTTKLKYTYEWTRHTTHSNEGNTEDSDKITITNKSNIAINAQFGFAPETKYSGVSGKFYNDSGYGTPLNTGVNNDTTQLDSAVGGSKREDTVYMKLVGDSTRTPTNNETIGTVTVTVSKRVDS